LDFISKGRRTVLKKKGKKKKGHAKRELVHHKKKKKRKKEKTGKGKKTRKELGKGRPPHEPVEAEQTGPVKSLIPNEGTCLASVEGNII